MLDVGKKVSGALAGPRVEPREAAIVTGVQTLDEPVVADAGSPVSAPPAPSRVTEAPDEIAASAVEAARAAAVVEGGAAVGAHLGVEAEPVGPQDEPQYVVTHSFATTDPAYVGWRWAVTVARAEGSDDVTVDEVVLLPGAGALLAPAWVPWNERIQPGDLSPGDLMPPSPDDPRLVPSYTDVDAERLPFELHRELGLGRPRVLSLDGRADAAERWYDGPAGPSSPLAKAAPAACGSCGFLVPLAGALGTVFGVCANGIASDDGRAVALTHGCGAHSETVLDIPDSSTGMVVQDEEFDIVDTDARDAPTPDGVTTSDDAAAPDDDGPAPDATQ